MILNVHQSNISLLGKNLCEKYQVLLLVDNLGETYLGHVSPPPSGLKDILKSRFKVLPKDLRISQKFFFKNLKFLPIQEELENIKENVQEVMDLILIRGLELQASDIHIETFGEYGWLRFRIDGYLENIALLDKNLYKALCLKIKLESKLDITDIRQAQDGRYTKKNLHKEYDLRISVLPIYYGESIVIRILMKFKKTLNLDDLGLSQSHLSQIQFNINKSHGIILITGPTGSGKSTTQYALLQELQDKHLKIITIEDPIEYQMNFATQIQVNEQMSFSKALRSILRQDPDVIVVGEIRDQETLKLAFEAALTGHLVLATLHANDAYSSLERLVNMGLDNHTIFASLLLIISQRLLRSLCPYCKKEYEGSWEASGCKECEMQGTMGRRLVCEICEISYEVRKHIQMEGRAVLPSYPTLYDDAKEKNCFSQEELEKLL